ncbi:MAG: hypothetical protein DMF00_03875 [Verrucomicrobia bacterium]|nr:MAG: hypothetical protein DMF00_03875 [Verrucomicrobiota bacterium]
MLSDRFIIEIPEAGLNFLAWLRCEANFARVVRVCTEIGIKLSPLRFIASNQAQADICFRFCCLGRAHRFENPSSGPHLDSGDIKRSALPNAQFTRS